MALRNKSLFLYGYDITPNNSSIDFVAVSGGPILLATLPVGSYTLTDLCAQIKASMQAVDPARTYTVTALRNYAGGLENRITISTNGIFLSLLFNSGPRVASSVAPLLGFAAVDQTGGTSYTGSSTTGSILVSEYVGYNWLGPDFEQKVFGALNISASGLKEAIVWQIQKFFEVEFRYEPEAKVIAQWLPLWNWMIQQKPLEFTPDYTLPTSFYPCTLESTAADSKGLGFTMTEMLPEMPFVYKTGKLKFRQKI
jgi:hypothetical protein